MRKRNTIDSAPHDAMKISIRYKLFLSHFLAIMLVSGSIGSYFYSNAIDNLIESLQSRLKYSAALLSYSFTPSELENIRTELDVESEEYRALKQRIEALANTNPDIEFVYVMRLEGNAVSFVLDSDTEEPALPGEVYDEYIPELVAGFEVLSVDSEITSDRWGNFMSGYAPLAGSDADAPYLIGIDMRADEVAEKLSDLKQKGFLSLLLSVFLAWLSAYLLSKGMLTRIRHLHERCQAFSPLTGKVRLHGGDELDGLGKAFSYMMDSVQATHEDLERQVRTRTAELEDINERLTDEVDERRRMERILQESARTDYLTGLINRREMTNKLNSTTHLNESLALPFCVVLVDIDGFKAINDELGHDIGDEVLRKFARTLLHLVRDTDETARWGGEEFLIYMPNATLEQASRESERIREALNALTIHVGKRDLKVTASFGVARHRRGDSWETTVKYADQALYRAKAAGRNTVLAAEES